MLLCYKGNEIKQVSGGLLLLFFSFLPPKKGKCRLLGEETALCLWGGINYSLARPT